MSVAEPKPARLLPVDYVDLPGWASDDHASAFAAFCRSAERLLNHLPTEKPLGPAPGDLVRVARIALGEAAATTPSTARAFFETHFRPHRIEPFEGTGFVTGYFEPEVDGAPDRSAAFPVPIYGRPDDLTEIGPDHRLPGLDPALTWAGRSPDGRLFEYPDRNAIMAGALDGKAPVLAYVANWVEAFFIHVQGSARIRLPDGEVRRITFAAKSGHPYFAIAKVLVERRMMQPAEATADVLKRWLLDNPDEAMAVMARNRSFIFFREAPVPDPALGPVAAAGVALTPGRSLAVDRNLMTFHAPVFVESGLEGVEGIGPDGFARLMVAQDTGSAILGPSRGDIFFGSGEEAWTRAARVRHPARFTLLLPRSEPARGP